LQVLVCAGGMVGVGGFVGIGVGAGGVFTGICCMMVTGGGVGLLTDAMHSRMPVTPRRPERI
jgi:hypothetical protein